MKIATMKHFDDVTFAVFNSYPEEADKGKIAVLKRYGVEGWNKVELLVKDGIMNVFNSEPTNETVLYVNTIAKLADARYGLTKNTLTVKV